MLLDAGLDIACVDTTIYLTVEFLVLHPSFVTIGFQCMERDWSRKSLTGAVPS